MVHWSRARATWGPLELCACDLQTIQAVRALPEFHWNRAHATCRPYEPCVRDLRSIVAVRTQPQSERGPGTSASEDRGQAKRPMISTSVLLHKALVGVGVGVTELL